ncbi:MAG: helix-turn-helix domain-containing protein [Candidatus Limnocylindrales bacterium]
MTTRERPGDRAAFRAVRDLVRIGEEVRVARQSSGLSQARVAKAAGGSQAQLSRLEHGRVRHLDVLTLSRVLAVTGLRLSIRTFPEGSPIRDAAHVALLTRLKGRLAPVWTWSLEVPVRPDADPRSPGFDPRRWDAVVTIPQASVAFEAETRLYDAQGQIGRARSKQAVGSTDRLVLVIAETHHNRRVLREIRTLVRDDFPLAGRAVLAALGDGRDPGANGIVVL